MHTQCFIKVGVFLPQKIHDMPRCVCVHAYFYTQTQKLRAHFAVLSVLQLYPGVYSLHFLTQTPVCLAAHANESS